MLKEKFDEAIEAYTLLSNIKLSIIAEYEL
jgi:hypothetical protein